MSDFVASNNDTLHYGSRENGAECGTQSKSWAKVDAENPLDGVVTYALEPCNRCFKRSGDLRYVLLIDHSAHVMPKDRDEIINRLPWGDPDE